MKKLHNRTNEFSQTCLLLRALFFPCTGMCLLSGYQWQLDVTKPHLRRTDTMDVIIGIVRCNCLGKRRSDWSVTKSRQLIVIFRKIHYISTKVWFNRHYLRGLDIYYCDQYSWPTVYIYGWSLYTAMIRRTIIEVAINPTPYDIMPGIS